MLQGETEFLGHLQDFFFGIGASVDISCRRSRSFR